MQEAAKTCEYSSNNAFIFNGNNGNVNNTNKYNSYAVRPVSEFQDISPAFLDFFESLEVAFKLCLIHKTGSPNTIRFRLDESANLRSLAHAIWNCEYVPKESISFLVYRPCVREVIAADFSDRIVHHWVMLRIEPLLEDGVLDSRQYSCRTGKGTLAAIRRMQEDIAIVSRRYTEPCYVASWDISSFFMSIDKRRVYEELVSLIQSKYMGADKDLLLYLVRVLTLCQPQEHSIRHTPITEWEKLPKQKSKYNLAWFMGLEIGNLPSQHDANFYNAPVMRWIRSLEVRVVDYVDDFAGAFVSKEQYAAFIASLRNYMLVERGLTMHPRKHYFQYHGKGIKVLGGVVKYKRIYISNRTVGNFERKIHWFNETCAGRHHRLARYAEPFCAIINSYLGLMRHFYAYNIRCREAEAILSVWEGYISFDEARSKAIAAPKYNRHKRAIYNAYRQHRRDLRTIKQLYSYAS